MNQTPIVTISETNPGDEPLPDLTAPLESKTALNKSIKSTRENAIDQVTNARDIPRGLKMHILDELALIPDRHHLVMVTVFRHPHKNGGNFGATVVEI